MSRKNPYLEFDLWGCVSARSTGPELDSSTGPAGHLFPPSCFLCQRRRGLSATYGDRACVAARKRLCSAAPLQPSLWINSPRHRAL